MSWIVVAVVFLAWSNGANDNFKGVATLYGSGTATYRRALAWATATTLAGALLTLAVASALVRTFSAKGLVPDAIATAPAFLGAAALAAAVTLLVATFAGMPVSTTHALTGALLGAGLASGAPLDLRLLGRSFLLPLLLSPLLAAGLAAGLHRLARRRTLGTERAIRWAGALDRLHFLSAGAVCFARALNDAPKIVAIALGTRALGAPLGLGVVGVAMALGGVMAGRRVAETMSRKILPLDTHQGLVANLTTAALVLAASRFGLPVSTTQVAGGSLFGLGAVTKTARWRTVGAILLAWLTTLPLGAALGALAMLASRPR